MLSLVRYGASLGLLVAVPAAADEAVHQPDIAAGQRIALDVCAACHTLATGQPAEPILRPPAVALSSIANRPGTTLDSLRRYIARLHPATAKPRQMPDPELTDDQVTDVAAFILTLRKPQ